MGRKTRPPAIGTRYDQREIAIKIEKLRAARGHEPKAAYQLLGIGKGEYSRKERGKVPFTLWETSKLADWLEAGPGWPFIDEALADQLRSVPVTPPAPVLIAAEPVTRHRAPKGAKKK